MTGPLKIRIFAHSWISDWNHGNAHFLRGLARELKNLGHEVRCYEAVNAWSADNLLHEGKDTAEQAVLAFRRAFPNLDVRFYSNDATFTSFAEQELCDAEVVIIHEWNEAAVVAAIAALRRRFGFKILFHDTHHRAYTNPREILRFPLADFDGVLAFGEPIRKIYEDVFGVENTWTLQEAADTDNFHPIPSEKDTDVIWVGNWGDEERTAELREFLVGPASSLAGKRIAVHGVRYPDHAKSTLKNAGIEYRGYLPNLEAPRVYARSALSLHVPRRCYTNGLSGVPTIRVFEVLACGVPLVCSPWSDTEGLFRPGQDYICVPDGRAMKAEIEHLLSDDKARQQIAAKGLETIRTRHTCRHRAIQLAGIFEELGR